VGACKFWLLSPVRLPVPPLQQPFGFLSLPQLWPRRTAVVLVVDGGELLDLFRRPSLPAVSGPLAVVVPRESAAEAAQASRQFLDQIGLERAKARPLPSSSSLQKDAHQFPHCRLQFSLQAA